MASDRETIVLGGGCFWCTEACFNLVEGVLDSHARIRRRHHQKP